MRDIGIKEIKFMFDYSSSCLWDNSGGKNNGIMIEAEEIGLSVIIEDKINQWCLKMDNLFTPEIYGGILVRKKILNSNKYRQYKKEQFLLSKLIIKDTGIKLNIIYEDKI